MVKHKSIKDVPIANEKLYNDVARLNKVSNTTVENIINFVGTYIHDTIKNGTMETVHIPYFGKFKPKLSKVRATAKIDQNKRSGKDLIYRAKKGMKLIDKRLPEDRDNETI